MFFNWENSSIITNILNTKFVEMLMRLVSMYCCGKLKIQQLTDIIYKFRKKASTLDRYYILKK